MAIVKYIPKKGTIIDRRSENGGYYHANCEVCGTEFYPKRNNAKYCGRNCSVMAYKKRVKLNGGEKTVKAQKKTVAEVEKTDKDAAKTFRSMPVLIKYLQKQPITGRKLAGKEALSGFKSELKTLKIGNLLSFGGLIIKRVSKQRFSI